MILSIIIDLKTFALKSIKTIVKHLKTGRVLKINSVLIKHNLYSQGNSLSVNLSKGKHSVICNMSEKRFKCCLHFF